MSGFGVIASEEGGLAYEISSKDGVGRILVASRDVEPLEVILEDEPAASGPEADGQYAPCPACCRTVNEEEDEEWIACEECGLLHCSLECASAHLGCPECQILAKRSKKCAIDPRGYARCALPLRLALLLEGEKADSVSQLMDHNEVRRKDDPQTWRQYQDLVVNYLTDGLGVPISPDTLTRAAGIVRTNGISGSDPSQQGVRFRAVYPKVSLISHSCHHVSARCVQGPERSIQIRAQRSLERGEEVSISYTSILTATAKRRALLKRNWCFDCTCQR